MKTTVIIPDELFQLAKAKAALEGIRLQDLVVQGLQLAISESAVPNKERRTHFPLIQAEPDAEFLTDEQVAAALEQMAEAEIKPDADLV